MPNQNDVEEPNKDVLAFLTYYCQPENPFDYAVMLRGPWGSGKTYLINRFLRQREKEGSKKALYISLYGTSTLQQIEDAFFRQLHPVLASKGMKIVAGLAKATLKGTLKIDLTDDDQVSISPQLPKIDLQEYFKAPADCLLVFDDLERCSLPIAEVLGYINAFVEHEGFKVVVIANEVQILKQSNADEPSNTRYAEIKEKLFGQTLEVRSTARSAIKTFFSLIRDERTRKFLEENEETILLLHNQSGTNNLRLLKHSLWDFERVSACFSQKHWENSEAVTTILRLVMALSFEVRSGKLKEEQFPSLQDNRFAKQLRRDKGESKSALDELESRYPELSFEQSIIGLDLLKSLLFSGGIDPASITAALNNSPYYAAPNSGPTWRRLWHLWELDDQGFAQSASTVEQQFVRREFVVPGEMLHVFGLRLLLSDIQAIPRTKKMVVDECNTSSTSE